MFGKTYNTIGSTDSNFIIKTKGDLKIQWGNKFIDLIKNGKITENQFFKKVNSEKDISNNGIYLVNDTIWIKIDDCKTPISTIDSTTYVSFIEKQESTPEQKQQALQNIGLFYDSLESVNSAGIVSGIVYVQNNNKLYTINKGIITEYSTNNILQENGDIIQCNTIQGDKFLKFLVGDFSYMVMQDLKITLHKNLVVDDNIQITSKNATEDFGFRLWQNQDKSILEIDTLKLRNYPEPITYNELVSLISESKLKPAKYYLLTDFQNPWEVSWPEESLYLEDKFEKVNGADVLTQKRNALQLVIQANSTSTIKKQVLSPAHPNWVIEYDWEYKGAENIIVTSKGEVTKYGFRTRYDEGETTFLSCKGRITYLKDEFGNEGNFNFRQFLTQYQYTDPDTDITYYVWRHLIDKFSIKNHKKVFFGEFLTPETPIITNNKFFIENLDAQIQVFKYLPETNRFTSIDTYVNVSEGLQVYINSVEIKNNTITQFGYFDTEHPPRIRIENAKNVLDNTYENITSVQSIGNFDIINNSLTESSLHSVDDCKNNTLIKTDLKDLQNTLIPFNDNYINNSTISTAAMGMGNINNNYIINSEIRLSHSGMFGSFGQFNGNTVENSVLTNNDALDNIINDNTIINSEVSLFGSNYEFIANKIKDCQLLTINNDEQKILENLLITVGEINNIGVIQNNYIEGIITINNEGEFVNNSIKGTNSISNVGELKNNTIEHINGLVNESQLLDNIIGDATNINNSGYFNGNTINNISVLTNNSAKFFLDNKISSLKNFQNNGNIENNNIVECEDINNEGKILNNTITYIKGINNYAVISNNTFDTLFGMTIEYAMDNNTSGILNTCIISGPFNNNIITGKLIECTTGDVFENNTISSTITSVEFSEAENNFISGDITNCKFKQLVDTIIKGSIENSEFSKSVTKCEFNKKINNFKVALLYKCFFEYLTDLDLSEKSIYNTKFHGYIGGDKIFRDLTNIDFELLKDENKLKDVYPNIKVVCVPEIYIPGMIMMWYGDTSEIPQGWVLCDGNNGTPDLRNRFIKGGTQASLNNPSNVSEDNKISLSLNNLPEHFHKYSMASGEKVQIEPSSNNQNELINVINEIDYTTYSTTAVGSGESFNIEPRSYSLIFIMKIEENKKIEDV